jgi:hypothetical protein
MKPRKWEKTDKRGRTTVTVKGRDYFDLLWYLQKGIRPNLTCIEGINEIEALKKKLLGMISRLGSRSIQLDLEALIEDDRLAGNLGRNMKTIQEREIKESLIALDKPGYRKAPWSSVLTSPAAAGRGLPVLTI